MSYKRPVVLSIAGYDPSGGAGVLADIKTFEQHRCLGMAAVTALTVQTEDAFHQWTPFDLEQIRVQVAPLLECYELQWLKIGLFPCPVILGKLLCWLKERRPCLRIVWDPVIGATAGFSFMEIQGVFWPEILKYIYLLTPNVPEARLLSGLTAEVEAAKKLSEYCNVLLKGGHSDVAPGTDRLWIDGRQIDIPPLAGKFYPKHGSGCILSAAITANLAKGMPLEQACREGKRYIEQVLNSNTQLLAYHAE